MSGRAKLPVSLLVTVAALQIWLSRAHDLSPWAGGGFGMFASADVRGTRHLHAYAIYPAARRELAVPEDAFDRARRALSFPSRRALERLAARLGEQRDPVWGTPGAIELQVFQTRLEPHTLSPSTHLLRALTVPLADR